MRAAARWPRPLLNPPQLVGNLDRDKLHRLLSGIEGLEIPATIGVTRAQLFDVSQSELRASDIAAELAFPLIVRPRGSHAGVGLAKLDDGAAIARYLAERREGGVLRLALCRLCAARTACSANTGSSSSIGKPYACHMAIADRWDIWYLNAGMSHSATKRCEEETFMRAFDIGFAPPPSRRRWPAWPSASASIISRSIARRTRDGDRC